MEVRQAKQRLAGASVDRNPLVRLAWFFDDFDSTHPHGPALTQDAAPPEIIDAVVGGPVKGLSADCWQEICDDGRPMCRPDAASTVRGCSPRLA
jgi:hypothetical protein